ncbi:MAG: cytochrome C oxidase subunit IV family protein [Bacteroidia bacterium]|nr:cytochrome C oxidase subunit IV family protein [Bacteroidia bacterium]
MSHERDDVYEYSLDTHHDEATGKEVRKKIYVVLILLSIVTAVEVGLGFKFSRVESLKETLKWLFIALTLVKAGGIVYYFMHLGDERKNFRYIILSSYFVLIGYLIWICLTEATYNSENKAGIEISYKELNASTPAPVASEGHGDTHSSESHGAEEHH